MAVTAKVSSKNVTQLGLVQKSESATPAQQICRVSHRTLDDTAIIKAQQIWDTYFAKMLATFHEPNPHLNRDLALDRTIRALGQRPLTAKEQANLPRYYSSGSSSRGGYHYPTRQSVKLERTCRDEEFFEELCNSAFDA